MLDLLPLIQVHLRGFEELTLLFLYRLYTGQK